MKQQTQTRDANNNRPIARGMLLIYHSLHVGYGKTRKQTQSPITLWRVNDWKE